MTRQFWEALEFVVVDVTPGRQPYLTADRDGAELHFYPADENAAVGPGSCYIVVPDIDELFRLWEPVVAAFGPAASIQRPQVQFYGVRELVLVDPNGNQIRLATSAH